MVVETFTPNHLYAILPEILLLVLAFLILIIDLAFRPSRRNLLGWITALGLAVILIVTLLFCRPDGSGALIFGGTLHYDWPAFSFTVIILFAAMIVSLLSIDVLGIGNQGEYYALLLVATIGMVLMSAAADLIMIFLAIETASIPLYLLAGYLRGSDLSTESGLKYFLFGAAASAVMAYGFSLLYGFTGTTNLYAIAEVIGSGEASVYLIGAVIFLILVGLAFKVAIVPFHFWAPDVYEGAPTPITAYISTASKAAGFIILVRVMLIAFPSLSTGWTAVLAALSIATMTLGNLLAIPQHNIKRLLAYSSIAHAGYALIGLAALSLLGTASLIFYLLAYVVTNLAAFAVVILFSHTTGSDEISDYAGLSRRSPGLALALMVALLSLAGMPPLAGFVAKFYVFASAVQSQLIWLAFIGVINAIVGLYYYLTVLKVVYLYRSEEEDKSISIPSSYAIALVTCTALIVLIGVMSGPWMDWALEITRGFF